mmetsp:Transcript_31515/g.43741  ORF Transcript_31515/g.43741 Transcript_31515/m.43741 type:complete len:211 (+) Transcript_31515:155-787(+)|eukprot:CAMPEP_0196585102 /NCGR_PEP_ID=MMETSP1081-20130531/49528_1 /TAXON_ID=36882 /ORGANISM="Pyramimonas amylifera, Strain CCMP720" /LENGTH=210 /DNA_ID=CAMNT_0041906537 /DNA_START=144 /DNA_END=776 /DNA_ORIENTATION=-
MSTENKHSSNEIEVTDKGLDVREERREISRYANEVAMELQEPKVTLVCSAIDVLGMLPVRHLVEEVREIQLSGGQWTQDGLRRRTPGGIFWNLVRSTATKTEYTDIFAVEKENERARARKRQHDRNLRRATSGCQPVQPQDGEPEEEEGVADDDVTLVTLGRPWLTEVQAEDPPAGPQGFSLVDPTTTLINITKAGEKESVTKARRESRA